MEAGLWRSTLSPGREASRQAYFQRWQCPRQSIFGAHKSYFSFWGHSRPGDSLRWDRQPLPSPPPTPRWAAFWPVVPVWGLEDSVGRLVLSIQQSDQGPRFAASQYESPGPMTRLPCVPFPDLSNGETTSLVTVQGSCETKRQAPKHLKNPNSFFFFLFSMHLWHMEVPRLGV